MAIEKSSKTKVICIDGPAGSGKSTVACKIASKLGFIHLNSGALFRAIAYKAKELGVEGSGTGFLLDDQQAIASLASQTVFSFEQRDQITQLLVDGKDLGTLIHTPEIGMMASKIAVNPFLREPLLQVQRKVAMDHSLVVEGRDAGTVVFPDADLKIYLDAPLEVRAQRRFQEMKGKEKECLLSEQEILQEIAQGIAERDHRDETREVAPQQQADDAIRIDTSELSIDQVVGKVYEQYKRYL